MSGGVREANNLGRIMLIFDNKIKKSFILTVLVFIFVISCSSSSDDLRNEQSNGENGNWNTRQITIDSIQIQHQFRYCPFQLMIGKSI